MADDPDQSSLDDIFPSVAGLLEVCDTPWRLHRLGREPLPVGTIDVPIDEYWSRRDAHAQLQGMATDTFIEGIEAEHWALLAQLDDGRWIRLRPSALADSGDA